MGRSSWGGRRRQFVGGDEYVQGDAAPTGVVGELCFDQEAGGHQGSHRFQDGGAFQSELVFESAHVDGVVGSATRQVEQGV
jgi:hypothetical protein